MTRIDHDRSLLGSRRQANVWSLGWTLRDLVREAIQNSGDAALPGAQRVQVVLRVIRLTGEDLRAYQRAIGWEGLNRHLEASTANGQKLGTLIRDGN
jgi:hypothetical protein